MCKSEGAGEEVEDEVTALDAKETLSAESPTSSIEGPRKTS